jgi:hypothetical protein
MPVVFNKLFWLSIEGIELKDKKYMGIELNDIKYGNWIKRYKVYITLYRYKTYITTQKLKRKSYIERESFWFISLYRLIQFPLLDK